MRRLIIRPGAIGDCILSLPALQHLTASYTEIWSPSTVIPLIQFADRVASIASTGIDRIGLNSDECIPPPLLQRLQDFDEIVSWYGTKRPDFRSTLESAGVPCVFHNALPETDSRLHAIDFFCSQVGAPLGLSPRIQVPNRPRRRTIVIQPFSGSSLKNWPLENYRELARLLPLPVEWLAGPDEVLDGAHRFENLLELAQWLSVAMLYIGNDSGITHLAAAVRMPVIALFRSTNPAIWAPRGPNARSVLSNSTHPAFTIEGVLEIASQFGEF